MSDHPAPARREGSLEAPTRHPIPWKTDEYYDEKALFAELERVYDICHGCRRCVSLCTSFPTLFDLVDESKTGEVDGVDKKDYWKVVDQCYLCDLCYMTKCPYVPPHSFNIDFPHLLLRARAVENLCHVLAPAQGGLHESGRRTFGHSLAIGPWGEVLAVQAEGPGVVLADLDRARQNMVRSQLPALTHRVMG